MGRAAPARAGRCRNASSGYDRAAGQHAAAPLTQVILRLVAGSWQPTKFSSVCACAADPDGGTEPGSKIICVVSLAWLAGTQNVRIRMATAMISPEPSAVQNGGLECVNRTGDVPLVYLRWTWRSCRVRWVAASVLLGPRRRPLHGLVRRCPWIRPSAPFPARTHDGQGRPRT
jgi:hypothetical protein